MAERTHAAAADGVLGVALDLLGVAVDGAHPNAAVRLALAAHRRAPQRRSRRHGAPLELLGEELRLAARAALEQRHPEGGAGGFEEIAAVERRHG